MGFVLLVLGTVACVMYSRKAKSKPELLGIAMSVQSPIGQAGRVDEPAAAAADAKPPPPRRVGAGASAKQARARRLAV